MLEGKLEGVEGEESDAQACALNLKGKGGEG